MTQLGPDPNIIAPLPHYDKLVFLKNVVNNPNVIIGDYTYYDGPDAYQFEQNILYHFDFIGDKLIIAKFCSIGRGTQFIMNGGNHQLGLISTYPFGIFGNGWEAAGVQGAFKGDTVIGNDVWTGYDSTIMPGVTVGHGAVIGSKSVVTGDVPPYTIVGGNPAKPIRTRFDEATIAQLLEIAWWDWPIEKISRNIAIVAAGDISALATCK